MDDASCSADEMIFLVATFLFIIFLPHADVAVGVQIAPSNQCLLMLGR